MILKHIRLVQKFKILAQIVIFQTIIYNCSQAQKIDTNIQISIDNRTCTFPAIYNNQFHTECFDVDGVLSCFVNSTEIVPCKVDSERCTVDDVPCDAAAMYAMLSNFPKSFSFDFTDCLSINFTDVCLTEQDGNFQDCKPRDEPCSPFSPPPPSSSPPSPLTLSPTPLSPLSLPPPPISPLPLSPPSISLPPLPLPPLSPKFLPPQPELSPQSPLEIMTINNKTCQFPFIYQNITYNNSCAIKDNDTSITVCITQEDGILDICAPKNFNDPEINLAPVILANLFFIFLLILIIVVVLYIYRRNKESLLEKNKMEISQGKKQGDPETNFEAMVEYNIETRKSQVLDVNFQEDGDEVEVEVSEIQEERPRVNREVLKAPKRFNSAMELYVSEIDEERPRTVRFSLSDNTKR